MVTWGERTFSTLVMDMLLEAVLEMIGSMMSSTSGGLDDGEQDDPIRASISLLATRVMEPPDLLFTPTEVWSCSAP